MSRHFTFTPDQHDVPVAVVDVLDERARDGSLPMILIGAAARDLCVHAPLSESPTRTTHDVDIAVAVPRGEAFTRFTADFEPVGDAEHKFLVMGVEVDIVPFGGVETDGAVTFTDGSVLDVVGLSEAMRSPDLVTLTPDLTVKVASIEVQTALKVLAWRDRHMENPKDAPDLHAVLSAGSRGPYADEMWADGGALEACGYVPDLAGAYRLGRTCKEGFTAERARAVADVLDDPGSFARLALQMQHLTSDELLDAYARGFRAGVPMA